MTRYCLLICVVSLATAVSCDQVTEQFGIRVQDESVSSDEESGAETAGGKEARRVGGTGTEYVAFKPVGEDAAAGVTADGEDAEPTRSVEALAVELAAEELAVNLRLLEEEDADNRAELEREMVSLRVQRRALFETRVEGN